jgi:hypothetical protein
MEKGERKKSEIVKVIAKFRLAKIADVFCFIPHVS